MRRSVARLRDASLPWVFAVGVAIAWALADAQRADDKEMAWSLGPDGSIGFGGAWLAYVVRPMLFALIVGWLWRLALVTGWMWRVARLPLSLVPTHPDRTGGIAFIEKLPGALALVKRMRTAAIGRYTLQVILVPMAIPFCLLALLKLPLASILSTLFKVLI